MLLERVESPDGLVGVTVDAGGEVLEIHLADDVASLDGAQLGCLIAATVNRAFRGAAHRIAEDTRLPDDDMFAEWQRAIAAMEAESRECSTPAEVSIPLCTIPEGIRR